jgi:hypothetical protein
MPSIFASSVPTPPHEEKLSAVITCNKLSNGLRRATNQSNAKLVLSPSFKKALDERNRADIREAIHPNPSLKNTILGRFTNSSSLPNRFQPINGLAPQEVGNYKQLSNSNSIERIRANLLSLIDEDLKAPFELVLKEWAVFGISVTEVDTPTYARFKKFYDEKMSEHAIRKDDYSKLDFAAQNIKPCIADNRCLDAKLTPLQIFRAAYQLGEEPAVSNFRFMENPPSKGDGKYREWMYHFDNSNYDAEFKLISTRRSNTCEANDEQCLAAFPYDTTKSIRYTQSEAATKFPTVENLEREFRGVPGACYVVIKNPGGIPLETGIRTEMIPHHRSASDEKGQESRSSELMTFHSVGRCKPFLSEKELAQEEHLTPLQRFVLGDFKNVEPGVFMERLASEKKILNDQVRSLITETKIKSLDSLTIAKFSIDGTTIIDRAQFDQQINTYENLPGLPDKLPLLTRDNYSLETISRIVPAMMNYDQNAALKPDCSENDAFPARTELRERAKSAFLTPLERDFGSIKSDINPSRDLLTPDRLIDIAQKIHIFYNDYIEQQPEAMQSKATIELYKSRAALAKEYTEQLPTRATTDETHQTLCLFLYYMIEDLNNITDAEATTPKLKQIREERVRILQHFVAHRTIGDSQKG